MSSPIPTPPVPPMTPKVRDALYGAWAWLSVLVFLAAIGWAVFGEVPVWLLAASVVINGFGSLTGFLAKGNTPTAE